jgi:hypothetical protein
MSFRLAGSMVFLIISLLAGAWLYLASVSTGPEPNINESLWLLFFFALYAMTWIIFTQRDVRYQFDFLSNFLWIAVPCVLLAVLHGLTGQRLRTFNRSPNSETLSLVFSSVRLFLFSLLAWIVFLPWRKSSSSQKWNSRKPWRILIYLLGAGLAIFIFVETSLNRSEPSISLESQVAFLRHGFRACGILLLSLLYSRAIISVLTQARKPKQDGPITDVFQENGT